MNNNFMNGFKDIYEMIHVPWWQQPIFKVALAAFIIVVLVLVSFMCIKKFWSTQKKKDPAQEALEALYGLRASDLLSEKNVMLFYVRLTHILKIYLGARYSYDLMGRTDPEILAYLGEQIIFPKDLLPVVSELVQRSQEIKFARGATLVDQMNKDVDAAFNLIRQTKHEQDR